MTSSHEILVAGVRATWASPPDCSPELLGAACTLAMLLIDQNPKISIADGAVSLVDSSSGRVFVGIDSGHVGPVATFAGLPPEEAALGAGVFERHAKMARGALIYVRSALT